MGMGASFTAASLNGLPGRRGVKRKERNSFCCASCAERQSWKVGRGSAKSSMSVSPPCFFGVRFLTMTV